MLQEINNGYFVDENGNIFNPAGLQMKTTVDKLGYVSIVIKQKRYLVHRLVAEKFISDFSADKQVHHIDGNKTNNSVNNLVCLTIAEHQKLHKQKYPKTKKCLICGREFTPKDTKRKLQQTCSREYFYEIAKIRAEKRKRPINQFSLDGAMIKRWDSARDIRNSMGLFESNINKCCNHKIRTYKGYIWQYAE